MVGGLPGPLCAFYQEASVIVLSLHCDVNFKHLIKVVTTSFSMGFPDSSVGKESACNAGDPVQFLGGEDPLEKG